MGYYLLENPPRVKQYIPRRSPETGCIVVHTPEAGVDVIAPDTKAEQVAKFISTRTDPGSYHVIVDSDSTVDMIPAHLEAAQDATGSNRYAYSISLACDANQWLWLAANHPAWVDDCLIRAADAAVAYARDLRARTGIVVQPRWLTKAESDAGLSGFITHATRDPKRRSDPGFWFPYDQFLLLYAARMFPPTPTNPEDEMAAPEHLLVKIAGTDKVWVTDVVTKIPVDTVAYMDLLRFFHKVTPGPSGKYDVGVPWFEWTREQVEAIPVLPTAKK